jgi:hypothetical protein
VAEADEIACATLGAESHPHSSMPFFASSIARAAIVMQPTASQSKG